MLKQIVVNTKALESMLFVWASLADKEKIADTFFIDLMESPEMAVAFDDDFDANAARKVLSAISNRELLNNASIKEKKFWNNNMWMMEDAEFTQQMVEPAKTLNLDAGLSEIPESFPYETVEIIFFPGTTETAVARKNQLFVNFFKIMVNIFDPEAPATIEGQPMDQFILSEIRKMA